MKKNKSSLIGAGLIIAAGAAAFLFSRKSPSKQTAVTYDHSSSHKGLIILGVLLVLAAAAVLIFAPGVRAAVFSFFASITLRQWLGTLAVILLLALSALSVVKLGAIALIGVIPALAAAAVLLFVPGVRASIAAFFAGITPRQWLWTLAVILLLPLLIFGLWLLRARLAIRRFNKKMETDPAPSTPAPPHRQAADSAADFIDRSQMSLLDLRILAAESRSRSIRNKAAGVCEILNRILLVLQEKPEQLSKVRNCLDYYVPTISDVLTKYLRLEKQNVLAADMSGKVSDFLSDMQKALEQQYGELFEDDKLNLTVDMEAATMISRKNGLLTDEASRVQGQESSITLTL